MTIKKNNVVVFGSAHAGKSTLAGFLYVKSSEKFDLERYIAKVKKDMGDQYDESQKYAYISDTIREERFKSDKKQKGSTRALHFHSINIDNKQNFIIIDTPGVEHRGKERTRGIFYGDIGVFVVEINQLIKDQNIGKEYLETLHNFFTQLFLWEKFRDNKQLIIVFSKMDLIEFSKEEYYKGKEIIKTICGDYYQESKIIPISILVKDGRGENIFAKATTMPWYNGPTLMESIKMSSVGQTAAIEKRPFFMCFEKVFNKHGLGKLIRGKILDGQLSKDAVIKLSPVALDHITCTVTATVKSLYIQDTGLTELALSGDITGINLYDVRYKTKRYNKNHMQTLPTTIIFDESLPVLLGNTLVYIIDIDLYDSLRCLEEVYVIWFGRTISGQILHCKKLSDTDMQIIVKMHQPISIPLYAGAPFHCKYLLKTDKKYFNGRLTHLGNVTKIIWQVKDIDMNLAKNNIQNISYQIYDGNIVIEPDDNIWLIMSRIKRLSEQCIIMNANDNIFSSYSIILDNGESNDH